MALQPEHFIAPIGEIEPSLFPGDEGSLTDRIGAYIIEAMAKPRVESDDAVRAWVYYRAFRAVFIRMSAEPTSQSLVDQGSESFSSDQATRFKKLADEALAEFHRLTAEPVRAENVPPTTFTPTTIRL